ncbi:MAG: hypothetical protein FWH43_08475 [Endomicrobia bacterium]|nr:hypothetical protein [Endomicrobiia bacterium]
MLSKKNKTGMNGLCEDVGKLCIFAACAYAAFVLIAAVCDKDKDSDYQERLRNAYEGLSPEEY